jgi:hypothetical protein
MELRVGLTLRSFNPLKLEVVQIIFKNAVRTSKRTQHFTLTKINWLMLFFREMIAVYTENHNDPTNAKCSVTDC